jgi:hypothetical protein
MKHGTKVKIIDGLGVGQIGFVRWWSPKHGHTVDLLGKNGRISSRCQGGIPVWYLKKTEDQPKCMCMECKFHKEGAYEEAT